MLSPDQVRKITKKHSFFKSTTFASKLFLKLTNAQIPPVISCVSILKFEPSNRTRKDIEKTLPWLLSLQPFYKFITYKEEISDYENILIELAMVLYYQYLKQNLLFKKIGEKGNFFYLIMTGKLAELQFTFTKEYLTEEEYLTHLIKLTLLNENQIASRIMSINKELINFKKETVEQYITTHTKYVYNELWAKANKSLLQCGINVKTFSGIVPSVEMYIKAIGAESDNVGSHSDKKCFYIGGFIYSRTLSGGDYIGDLIGYNNITKKVNENTAYIALENTDMGYINKIEYSNEEIFKIIAKRMSRVFSSIQRSYYIIQNIPPSIFLHHYSSLFTYKQVKKGDKLFFQNSLYNGVYFLAFGEYEVSSIRSYDELDNLMILLQTSLDNFNEFISPLQNEKLPMETITDLMNNKVYKSGEFLSESKDKRKIIIAKFNNKEVIGLNEYYNNKNNLYHFTVECTSDVGFYYYINKECFSYMINRERVLQESVMQLVELKVKYYIGTISKYKKSFLNTINTGILSKRNETINKTQQYQECISGGERSYHNIKCPKRMISLYINNNEFEEIRKGHVRGVRSLLFKEGKRYEEEHSTRGRNVLLRGNKKANWDCAKKCVTNNNTVSVNNRKYWGYSGCVKNAYNRNERLPPIYTNVNKSEDNLKKKFSLVHG